jgi:hypothetical protein
VSREAGQPSARTRVDVVARADGHRSADRLTYTEPGRAEGRGARRLGRRQVGQPQARSQRRSSCVRSPPSDRPTRLLVRRPRARARFEERRAALHCDRDEEARPRSGYRPGAPGGRQLEHVDEHLRAAAWMGASPLPPAWCRVTNLHAGRDHHSRDCGCRDRTHRSTSQPRLTPGPYIHEPSPNTGLHRHGSPTRLLMCTRGCLPRGGVGHSRMEPGIGSHKQRSRVRVGYSRKTCAASASSTLRRRHRAYG